MNSRGQAETIGLVLLLAITVAGVSVTVAMAGSALESAEHSTSVQRAEQSLSLLDARAALVALGRTDTQSVELSGSQDGSYEVHPDAGRIEVVRLDEDGDRIGTPIVNTSLGALTYRNGDTTVAFQGGGVWHSKGQGARMVSPPEFNYQGQTLTLPVIRVTGGESSYTGSPNVRLARNDAATNLSKFPSATRENPLRNGTVVVRVESEYFRGWARYFEDRSTGNVTVHPDEREVELELITRGSGGTYSLNEHPFELSGIGTGQPIDGMEFTLHEKQTGPPFQSLDWSLVADKGGGKRFVVNVGGGDPCDDDQNPVRIEYETGTTTHVWTNASAWSDSGTPFVHSCNGGDATLTFDLAADTNFTYQGPDPNSPLQNDSVGYVLNHALGEMGPNVDLAVEVKSTGNGNGGGKGGPPGNSAGLNMETSTVDLEYNSSSQRVLTFLHVTENAVNVTFT